ncbi:MAG: chromate resistance protein [Boseongicola sp.]|nr:chromate resistance protein [Boseongicola sp.]NNJ68030.1 sulfurtransferase [Boseongicola sp.]
MPAPNEITVAQLNRLIGTPECPDIVDLSINANFDTDPHLIPGAFRHPHTDPGGLRARLVNQKCVVVCQKGAKLSQGMAAWLRSDGVAAEYLSGGNLGWRDAPDTDRIPAAAIPPTPDGTTVWVTRHRPKIDRIACPWLIRRFVDRSAQFLFVSPGEVANVAERFGATPFDVPDADFTHKGALCTFDAMLDAFHLRSPALMRLAEIVRAADTDQGETVPQAAGLLAFSVGLSRQYKDDQAQLTAALPLYDALYRWARDGQSERHDWPGSHR